MSQIRKIKRKREKQKPGQSKGTRVMLWMAVAAVVLILIVAFLGFRNISTAPTPEILSEQSADEDILLTTTSGEMFAPNELSSGTEGSIFVFFLGAG